MTGPSDSVVALAEAVRSGRCSSGEAVSACLDRIASVDGDLNCFVSHDRDRALARAEEIDRSLAAGRPLGPLAGVPIAVKDNICTGSGRTTCGSRMLEGLHAGYDAFVIEKLEAAGAIIVGKTNLDEFAMGSSTENSAFGPARNPWATSRVTGGSSGGSAAAVAARMAPAALGSDTGGSIRQPASFCGTVGLKPSYGRVSRYGLVAFGSSLDQIGPITRDVRDAALLLGIIAGHDPRDSTCANEPVPDFTQGLDQSLDGVRLGISDEYFGEGCAEPVRNAVQDGAAAMEKNGAELVRIEMPHMKVGIPCYYTIVTAEASSNLARFDGVRFGRRADRPADVDDMYARSRGEGFGPEVKRRIMLGTYALSSGYYDAYYLKALKIRSLIAADFEKAFESVDAIVSPVSPTTAFPIGEKVDDPLAMYLCDLYTIAANLVGLCAVSVPCGFDPDGLPIGMQLMGRPFGEAGLLRIAHQYQQLTSHHAAVPPCAAVAGG